MVVGARVVVGAKVVVGARVVVGTRVVVEARVVVGTSVVVVLQGTLGYSRVLKCIQDTLFTHKLFENQKAKASKALE